MSYRKLKDSFTDDTRRLARSSLLDVCERYRLAVSSNARWMALQALISVAAGLIASFVTQPADVVKTYRQVAPNDYRNVYTTVKSILKVRIRLRRFLSNYSAMLYSNRQMGSSGSVAVSFFERSVARSSPQRRGRCTSTFSDGDRARILDHAEPIVEDIFLYTGHAKVLFQTKDGEPHLLRCETIAGDFTEH